MSDFELDFEFAKYIEEIVKREEEARKRSAQRLKEQENNPHKQQILRFRDKSQNKVVYKK